MMNRAFWLLSLFALLTGCKTTAPTITEIPTTPSNDMRQMGESFATLLPITLDPLQFNDPKNQDLIDQEVTKLSRFSHEVHVGAKNEDPSFAFISQKFAQEMNEAKHQLQIGNHSYARFLIRGASNYCISCHTQTDRGPHFLEHPEVNYFNRLNSLDKANYLIAIWNFDGGLKEYENAMSSPDAAMMPYASLESATLKALAVAVRVKKDPALAEAIVTRIMYSKWAPVYLQLTANKWKKSILEWKNTHKPAHTLDDAKALITKAWNAQMESPLSRAGLIESLRASSVLHELLAQKKAGKAYAEALYYAGLNAESLKDLDSFRLNEAYFEACVKHFPHSDVAKNCYLRLEGARIADYSAFEGMAVPQSVRDNLASLRKLAQPIEGSWMDWGRSNGE